jgi:hypothetical protein
MGGPGGPISCGQPVERGDCSIQEGSNRHGAGQIHILLNYEWDSRALLSLVFTSDCLAMMHEAANGSLRDADRLATAALREAARRKKKLVERDVLARVVDADGRADVA